MFKKLKHDMRVGTSAHYTPSLRRIVDKMRELRPIVETGYENILLVRLLIEEVRHDLCLTPGRFHSITPPPVYVRFQAQRKTMLMLQSKLPVRHERTYIAVCSRQFRRKGQ